MNFKITDIEYYTSFDLTKIDNILGSYGASLQEIENTLKSYTLVHHDIGGSQIDLSKQLARHLEDFFRSKPQNLIYRNKPYSTDVNFKSDVAIEHKESKKAIFIEIEFRPDSECKDIIKFQIGHKCGTLAVGILIVAKSRININPKYTTMPEFAKCKGIIGALQSECPILLIGLDWYKQV